jgi:hypothetical protein
VHKFEYKDAIFKELFSGHLLEGLTPNGRNKLDVKE